MYRHTQVGRVTLIALGAAVVLNLGLLAVFDDLAVRVLLVALVVVFALCALLFSALTVSVDAQHLTARFGPGPIAKRIPLSSIRDAQPVRNPWWYGWGIHLTPHGWLWNVSGFEAVELTLDGGQRIRIGTDEPQVLADVLARATRGAGLSPQR